VAAAPVDRDVDGVRVGECVSRHDSDDAGAQRGAVVERDRVVGLRESREEAVLDHAARASRPLLRRLAYQEERAAPVVLRLREERRRADERGHVHVVPAGVHDRNGRAGVVLRPDLARVSESGSLLDRQRVHVRADQHRRAAAVAEQRDDAEASDMVGDLVAELAQVVRELRRGPFFMERQLGVLVQVDVELLEIRIETIERSESRVKTGRSLREKRRRDTRRQSREERSLHWEPPIGF
jgi:hypothetical protein